MKHIQETKRCYQVALRKWQVDQFRVDCRAANYAFNAYINECRRLNALNNVLKDGDTVHQIITPAMSACDKLARNRAAYFPSLASSTLSSFQSGTIAGYHEVMKCSTADDVHKIELREVQDYTRGIYLFGVHPNTWRLCTDVEYPSGTLEIRYPGYSFIRTAQGGYTFDPAFEANVSSLQLMQVEDTWYASTKMYWAKSQYDLMDPDVVLRLSNEPTKLIDGKLYRNICNSSDALEWLEWQRLELNIKNEERLNKLKQFRSKGH